MNSTSRQLPLVYLVRHGETAWALSAQHTGLTDLPLTARGERNARRLGERLKGRAFVQVLTSPLRRAAHTWCGQIHFSPGRPLAFPIAIRYHRDVG